MKVYMIGALRNRDVIAPLSNELRALGYDVFDDWLSPGEHTDERWQAYEAARGRSYELAINGHHARTAFDLDKRHLDDSDIVVLVLPAGKSGHLEFGYAVGRGRAQTYILFDGEPERYDLMYRFADRLFFSREDLLEYFALDAVAPNDSRVISDGFGSSWRRCDRQDCGLEVVRPGKVQCHCDDEGAR